MSAAFRRGFRFDGGIAARRCPDGVLETRQNLQVECDARRITLRRRGVW